MELAEYGIRAARLCPGSTDTPMVTEVPRTRFPTYTAPKLMIQRMASPKKQANIACFASLRRRLVTGETIFCVCSVGKTLSRVRLDPSAHTPSRSCGARSSDNRGSRTTAHIEYAI
ncbi:MAG: SDR family oxidoreductase [Oscillospiraceae bacterium]